ncbi:MAG TPA: HEAT repeat domain-containing protein [Thermoguttaceae bacterium]|nr:HEAT repeat domain-containing protein [Thermoguttaceae bacterium]
MKRSAMGWIVPAVLLSAASLPASDDVFLLKTGGRVVGELLNPDEVPRKTYAIGLRCGGRITLDQVQVQAVLTQNPDLQQYEQICPRFPDTVEGQWALAQWCQDRGLSTQRKTHLERIIELDPDHAEARRLLGYQKSADRWLTREEIMAEQGYVGYKGRYRTSQEIELMENRRKTDLAEKEWARKINRWRDQLDTDKVAEGRQSLLAIRDPLAVPALVQNLAADPAPVVRILYIEVLAGIGTPDAVRALATCSLYDPVEEVRLTCLDYLQKDRHPDVIEYYAGKLRDKDNRAVNLAAVCLRRMKDPTAIRPLIDALVTVHRFQVGSSNPGSISTTFGTGPGGTGAPPGSGLSMGGGPKIVTQQIVNQAVLDALISLTGQNFNFDQRAWTYWYASQVRRDVLNARRD